MAEQPIQFTEADVKDSNLLLRLLRKFLDRILSIGSRVSNLEAAPPPMSVQQISRELQASGSAPLNIAQLPGVARQPQLAGAPRLPSIPAGQVLQQYQDTQLLLVGTTSTGYNLNAVVGGNPNVLYQLISGLSTGTVTSTSTNLMTLDTVQTSTGDKTLAGNWIFNGTLTATSTATFNNATYGGKITQYHGVTTTGEGVPAVLGRATVTGVSTAVSATTIFTPVSSGDYRVNYYVATLTTGTLAGVTPTVAWIDDLGLKTFQGTTFSLVASGADTRCIYVRSSAANPIQIQTSVGTSTVAPLGTYSVFASVERVA